MNSAVRDQRSEVGGQASDRSVGFSPRVGEVDWVAGAGPKGSPGDAPSLAAQPGLRLAPPAPATRRPRRSAFTLVELLVVITIIIILMGLLTPVIWIAITNAKEGRIKVEIGMLDSAFKAYKEKYGSYPPSDFTNVTNTSSPQYIALATHLAKAFPSCNVQAEISDMVNHKVNSPAKAVTFWLSGFSTDPEHPISGLPGGANATNPPQPRNAPFVDFDKTRLTFPDGATNAACYCPADTPGTPYVYFASQSYAMHVQNPFGPSYGQGGQGLLRPYAADPVPTGNTPPTPVNPNSFQIISAGLDNDYGDGGQTPPSKVDYFPSGTGYANGDKDNLTNFSDRNLGDSIPK